MKRFLTRTCNIYNLSPILVTVCITYLVGNEWEKGARVFLQLGY